MVAIAFNLLPFPNSPIPKRPFSCSSSSAPNQWRGSSPSVQFLGLRRLRPPRAAAITPTNEGSFDPELRSVLELATDEELFELENILFGPSYFSPLLKSITKRPEVDYIPEGEDIEGRDDFIAHIESRFLFLAADARSTLRGWRPSYRNVLLGVRRKLNVPCSSKLSTEDLEVEIFLHLLQEYSSQDIGSLFKFSSSQGSLEVGLSQGKVHGIAGFRVGAKELQRMILKGGGMLTLSKIFQLVAKIFSGKMLLEAANYEIKHEMIKRGGQLAAINLESRAALLAARQGLAGAASRYLGLRSVMMLLGPLLWGTFLADVVIQMLGTDYARVLRAIYAFAQAAVGTTDGVIGTVSAAHLTAPLIDLLKAHGKLVVVGASAEPMSVPSIPLLMGRKLVAGSCIGGMKETHEMIEFAAEHKITADIEIISMEYINTAMERLALR